MDNAGVLTIDEVAARLRLNRTTIWRNKLERKLGGVKVGGQWRFPTAAVDRFLKRGGYRDRRRRT